MAYARFSTNNYTSDVYVYAHVNGGYSVEVAGNRMLFDRETLPEVKADYKTNPDKWIEQYNHWQSELGERMKNAPRTFIEHELAGSSHHGLTAQQCYELLVDLENEGFIVPNNVAESILEDGDVEAFEEDTISAEELADILGVAPDTDINENGERKESDGN